MFTKDKIAEVLKEYLIPAPCSDGSEVYVIHEGSLEEISNKLGFNPEKHIPKRSDLGTCISALNKIAFPIKYLQKESEKEGSKLDGSAAIQFSNDANWLSGIAKKALEEVQT